VWSEERTAAEREGRHAARRLLGLPSDTSDSASEAGTASETEGEGAGGALFVDPDAEGSDRDTHLGPDLVSPAPVGTPLSDPPLMREISEDPVLRDTRLIAEAWDCGGLVQVGAFPHYGRAWSEWNGGFRDAVRSFVKGDPGQAGAFAGALCGSPDVFGRGPNNEYDADDWWVREGGGGRWKGGRPPTASVNFVTAHDGFTLRDLVSYNEKRNFANGEDNRDGEDHNLSWNCGHRGAEDDGPAGLADPAVARRRDRQSRNLLTALLLAHGTPMLLMGDEIGHTKGGNNNTYCHDGPLNWLDWENGDAGLARFTAALLRLRREHPGLARDYHPSDADIKWHGIRPNEPDWSDESRLVAFSVGGRGVSQSLYVAWNASHETVTIELPGPRSDFQWNRGRWRVALDSAAAAPYDVLLSAAEGRGRGYLAGGLDDEGLKAAHREHAPWMERGAWQLPPYSCVVLENDACAAPGT